MINRIKMCGGQGNGDSGRRSKMKPLHIPLLFLAAFWSPAHSARIAEHPRQLAEFNATTVTASASAGLGSSSSQDVIPPTQGETSAASSKTARSLVFATPSQHQTAGAQLPGGPLSKTTASGTGRTSATTSDEIGPQMSNISIIGRPSHEATRDTVSGFTSSFPTSNSSATVLSTSRFTPGHSDIAEGDQLVTFVIPDAWSTNGPEPEPTCIQTTQGAVPTTWSIVYTSTTTFYGDPTEYMPPYTEIMAPSICSSPADVEAGKSRVTTPIVTCAPTGDACTTLRALPSMVFTETSMGSPGIGPITTITFVTTAKNPSVVYSPVSTPRYGHSPDTKAPQDKHTAAEPTTRPLPPANGQRPPDSHAPPRESAKEPPPATYIVTVAPTKVIINDQTFTQKSPTETTEVVVGGARFTINPSEVLGGGTVVDRPGNAGRSIAAPSSTVVGGIPVVVAPAGSPLAVAVGGTTFGLQSTPVTVVVQGQNITIQPSAIIFPKQTVSINRYSPVQTEIVVAGGEMMTAIGPSVVVIRSTTFTYGLVSSTITRTVGDDTILVGPSGVVVHNMTLGGPRAKPTDTAYEIVGGATITQVGASIVVVGSATFTVGPGARATTTVIGGQTITIGPSGVVVSTLNLPYPFGPTVITTINAPVSTAASAPAPSETKTNGGTGVRHAKRAIGTRLEFCIVIGVWVLGRMV